MFIEVKFDTTFPSHAILRQSESDANIYIIFNINNIIIFRKIIVHICAPLDHHCI